MSHVGVSSSAIFFSYIDPETKITDTGFTEHSGCPVFEGEKKIVTQWIRLGVDEDSPWDAFNTLGIKLKAQSDSLDLKRIRFVVFQSNGLGNISAHILENPWSGSGQ